MDFNLNPEEAEFVKGVRAYVERLKMWEKSYSTRITKAVKNNSQVRGSWGVPEQVAKLVKKWKTT